MDSNRLLWTLQEDGSYLKSGELPQGTNWVTTEIACKVPLCVVRRVKEATEIIENAISKGYARAEWYALVPAVASKAMSEEAKTRLAQLTESRRLRREKGKENEDDGSTDAGADLSYTGDESPRTQAVQPNPEEAVGPESPARDSESQEASDGNQAG